MKKLLKAEQIISQMYQVNEINNNIRSIVGLNLTFGLILQPRYVFFNKPKLIKYYQLNHLTR